MKVSVVIPVYNKGPYLRECLDSVFAQTFTDFEAIAVDDRSTDDSLAILRSYTDPRLRIVALEKNRGPAGAVRVAMDQAQGEYIIRMDADDVSLPDRFAEQVRFMDAHPSLGISGTRMAYLGRSADEHVGPVTREDCMATVFFGVPIAQPTAIYRRSVLEQNGLHFDPNWPIIGEDWIFYAKAALSTSMANLDKVLVLYRKGTQNISYGQDMVRRWSDASRVALPFFGIEATDENVALHLLTKPAFVQEPDAAVVRSFRKWLNDLRTDRSGREHLPAKAFDQLCEVAWARLFPRLCDHGLAPALEHMRLSGKWPMDKLVYLMKVRVKALLK